MSAKKRWICLLIAALLIGSGGFLYYRKSAEDVSKNGGTFVESFDTKVQTEVFCTGNGGKVTFLQAEENGGKAAEMQQEKMGGQEAVNAFEICWERTGGLL